MAVVRMRCAARRRTGTLTLALGVANSRDVSGVAHRPPRMVFVERDGDGLAVRDLELQAEHLVHRVAHDAPGDDDGGRQGYGRGGEQEPPRTPGGVAKHHPRDGAEERVDAIEARATVARRRLRSHRLGRRNGDGLAHRRERPPYPGRDGHARRDRDRPGVEPEEVGREPEVPRVDDEDALRADHAEGHAEDRAQRADRERKLEEVHRELSRPVAERLQGRDLLALGADDARQENVQEEPGDPQEDDGERPRHLVQLGDLLVEQPARRLIVAAHRAQATVWLQDRVHTLDRLLLVRAHRELDGNVVEAADLPRGLGERVAVHPRDAEMPGIGQPGSRLRRPDELRRDGDADHAQLRQAAVDDRRQHRAGHQAPGLGERGTQENLVAAPRLDRSA